MARKFGVTQGEIVRYLAAKDIRIGEGSNVKLSESQIRLLYAHFAPGEKFEVRSLPVERRSVVPEEEFPPAASSPESVLQPTAQPSDDHVQPAATTTDLQTSRRVESNEPVVPAATPVPPSLDSPSLSQSEIIRASKTELAGLKVIGKIELPEPRKKDVSQPQPDGSAEQTIDKAGLTGDQPQGGGSIPSAEEAKGVARPRRRIEGRRQGDEREPRWNQRRDQRPRNNPIAAQREREQQEELERRKEKAAQDKERKTQNYNKRVKQSPPTKAIRLVEEQVEEMDATALEDAPKTWMGKLLKWFGF